MPCLHSVKVTMGAFNVGRDLESYLNGAERDSIRADLVSFGNLRGLNILARHLQSVQRATNRCVQFLLKWNLISYHSRKEVVCFSTVANKRMLLAGLRSLKLKYSRRPFAYSVERAAQ